MANSMTAVPKSVTQSATLDDALDGARVAKGDASSSVAPANPEVVAIARRKQFSRADKRRNSAPICPGSLQRSAADRMRRLSAGENWRAVASRRHLFLSP